MHKKYTFEYLNKKLMNLKLSARLKNGAITIVLMTAFSGLAFGDSNLDLVNAVKAHDVAGIKTAIANGANVNNADESGNSPIFGAVWWPDAVKALIDSRANVNLKNKAGATPLMSAAAQGETESVKLLLAAGADVKAVNDAGQSVLWLACSDGSQASTLKALVDAGADPNAKDKSGMTCLYVLVSFGKTPAERMATVKSQTPYFTKAGLVLNSRYTDPKVSDYSPVGEMVTVLINAKADVNVTLEPANITAMMMAAKNGRNDAIIALLNAHANFKEVSKNGWTALWLAADDLGCEEAALALIKAGADVNTTVGIAPLVQKNGIKAKPVHVKNYHGGSIDLDLTTDTHDVTVLMNAAKEGSAGLVKALIDAKADLNPRCEGGFNDGTAVVTISMTAVAVAANFGHPDVAKLLADAGAEDINESGKKRKR
jgi:uncharacterized protein